MEDKKEKYIVYYSFIIEAEDIEIAEKEALDITTPFVDSRIINPDTTVRGISL